MQIARIRNGIVVNVELADDDWLADGAGDDLLVPYTDSNPASIGLGYDAETGVFEQPAPPATTKPAPTDSDV